MSLGDASVCGNANDPLGLASGRSTYKVYTLVRVMVQALAYQRCNLYNRLEEANDKIACEVTNKDIGIKASYLAFEWGKINYIALAQRFWIQTHHRVCRLQTNRSCY